MKDIATLFATTLFATSVSGTLLVCASFLSRHNHALAIWAFGHLLGSAGATLIIARNSIDDFWSVDVAYTLLAGAFGVMWKGVRRFDSRPTAQLFVFAGAAIWLLTCLIVPIHASRSAQVVFISLIVVGYCLLIGIECQRISSNQLISYWPAIFILAVYAGTFLVRVFWPGPLLFTAVENNPGIPPSVAISIEVSFNVFCTNVFLAFFALQCTSHDRSWGSIIDPATGILNRRGFIECGARALRLMLINNQCATIVEFELNWRKRINNNYKHSVRNDVLSIFCNVISAVLRPCDLLGRIGDRRFSCLLANISYSEALVVAEKIKNRISHMQDDDNNLSPLHITITTRYRVVNARHVDLQSLMLEVEDALHQSKPQARSWIAAGKPTSIIAQVAVPKTTLRDKHLAS